MSGHGVSSLAQTSDTPSKVLKTLGVSMKTTSIAMALVTFSCPAKLACAQSVCNGEAAPVKFKTRAFPVQKVGSAVLFRARMEVDVDGAPNA
jgi:hypothetical protein